jgi:hypothetical protein
MKDDRDEACPVRETEEPPLLTASYQIAYERCAFGDAFGWCTQLG